MSDRCLAFVIEANAGIQSALAPLLVIPAKTGSQLLFALDQSNEQRQRQGAKATRKTKRTNNEQQQQQSKLDPGFRRDDDQKQGAPLLDEPVAG